MGSTDKTISAGLCARIAAGLAAQRLRPGRGMAERLDDIPTGRAPLSRPVLIHWDRHAIPFIEAETETDAAVALGVVHAHLRLGQIELFRRIAQGRLAEMVGPAALELDHGLRLLDFGRAVPAILDRMPARSRAWTEAFAAGLTHYLRHTPRLPPEFAWLGLDREDWSAADVLTLGRLASADVNWMILFNLVRLRGRPDWPELWASAVGRDGAVFQALDGAANPLARLATGTTRSGSNAVAVAGFRSASGAALMAADPHLNLTLPNLWLAASVKAPGFHACGLMIPGLPFVAIGRNPAAAWSGTSLQSASTDLFDARGLPLRPHPHSFRSRLGRDRATVLRDTALGPLISDSPLLGGVPPLALRWMGHRPSDEMTGWLGIARARHWRDFAAAARHLAVPGQNLVYADRDGHVGKLMAVHLPHRPARPQPDCVLPPAEAEAWRHLVTSADLPQIVDPADGIAVSANEQPRHAGIRVGSFFSAHDRYLRLHRLAGRRARLDLDDLAAMQADVFSETAVETKTWLARHLDNHPIAAVLDGWDAEYAEDSLGASAFELLLAAAHGHANGDAALAAYWSSWNPLRQMRSRLADCDAAELTRVLTGAAASVRPRPWGDLHRLRLPHLLAAVPFAGRAGRFTDLPMAGGNETLMKSAHGIAAGRHAVRFGANARFLADLADPDRNRVVLLGGQDGWIGSDTFLDQVPLWRDGASIALPLRPETARARAGWRTVLRP